MEKDSKRDRSANFSLEETNRLVDLVLKYATTIENKKTDACTWREKESVWEKLTSEFNARGLHPRNHKTLKIKYEGIKRQLRKKKANQRMELYKTGGGCSGAVCFTDCEEKLLPILINVDGISSTNDSDRIMEQISTASSNITENMLIHELNSDNGFTEPLSSPQLPVVEQHLSPAPISKETENIGAEIVDKGNETTPSMSWTSWTPQQLRKPPSTKLMTSKRVVRKEDLNSKFSSLAESRSELVELQIQIAKKELEIKVQLLENAVQDNERKKREHEIDMQIKKKFLDNVNKSKN